MPLDAFRPNAIVLIATVAAPAVTTPAAIAIASMAMKLATSPVISHALSDTLNVPAPSIS